MSTAELEEILGITLFDYQLEYFEHVQKNTALLRSCLFYRTGSGKSITALGALYLLGHKKCVVIAPPSTHETWEKLGIQLGVTVAAMSHAKFRMKTTLLSRSVPVIADEFHLFGGHKGQGWKKLDRLAAGLKAPLILASATPQYNDAERVYCVQHILDPHGVKGGYLQFLFNNCTTERNPFAVEPIVTGFKHYADAVSYLAALPNVHYLKDDTVFTIDPLPFKAALPSEFEDYGYDARRHRMMASQMEKRYETRVHALVRESGDQLHPHVEDLIEPYLLTGEPVLIFSASSAIAEAAAKSLGCKGFRHLLLTGKTPVKEKDRILNAFRSGGLPVLIGTATLATGTDGLDKVCDTLLILDDTDDDALRRQLIGRIMPRGAAVPGRRKQIIKLVPLLFTA